MTGPGHYVAAEQMLHEAGNRELPAVEFQSIMAAAQVHTTLALAAAKIGRASCRERV